MIVSGLNVEVWVRHAEQKFLADQCPTSKRGGGREAGLQLHLAVLSRGMKEICPASKIPRCSAEHAAHGPASETLSSHALRHSGPVLTLELLSSSVWMPLLSLWSFLVVSFQFFLISRSLE